MPVPGNSGKAYFYSGGKHHKGDNRVNRGGSWNNDAQNCRVANRNNNAPSNRNNNVGFRLVRSFQITGMPDSSH